MKVLLPSRGISKKIIFKNTHVSFWQQLGFDYITLSGTYTTCIQLLTCITGNSRLWLHQLAVHDTRGPYHARLPLRNAILAKVDRRVFENKLLVCGKEWGLIFSRRKIRKLATRGQPVPTHDMFRRHNKLWQSIAMYVY